MKWSGIGGYRRVSKWIAKKLYDDGEIIYMCPCNLRPGEPWFPEVRVCLTDGDGATSCPVDFDKIVERFAFYNCNNSAGYYPAYYVDKSVEYRRK